MKQAIYIFSLYIGVVTFFTLTNFGLVTELSVALSLLTVLASGIFIYAANRNEEKRNPDNV